MELKQQYVGSCLCGEIQYAVHGPIGDLVQCHCQRCRKANGSAYAVNAPIAKADFRWLSGEAYLARYSSSAGVERCFCRNCGSPIISIKVENPETYRLRIGTLDTPLEQSPTCHVFAASKAEWDQIYDDLPQYATRP